ncbi:MAG: hypothetical protein A2W99_17080 [Bacteroidetes bacterium GWF2_33_16]|nr:MAG: hypothetical protein A2X00_13715 [Bacteroidetes bacterium GWE2_32_14]OFY03461.1 MAG: hypothetical protein A2W99_17080 [Bacteroidetes bacterium GWF2_33_16]
MNRCLFVCVLLVISFSGFGQMFLPAIVITVQNSQLFLSEGTPEIEKDKYFNDYVLPFQIARKYYPELDDVTIDCVFKSIKTTMAARPGLSFLFTSKNKRKYKIFINTNNHKYKGVAFEELSLNAKVGIFGHELAHVFDYEGKSRWKVLRTGIQYLFKKKKQRLESKIDYIAIERGLGWQIFDFSDYVLNRSECCPAYKKYKKETYFTPDDIYFFIDQLKSVY